VLAEKQWVTYEEVVAQLLDTFAAYFGVERNEVSLNNLPGTTYEVDGKGFSRGNLGYFFIECRRYINTSQSRADVCAFAFQVEDTGAIGGIIVSPLVLKEGLTIVSEAKNVKRVQHNGLLDKHPLLSFLNSVMYGHSEFLCKRISSLSFRLHPEISISSKG
jgi:hypothetical protein